MGFIEGFHTLATLVFVARLRAGRAPAARARAAHGPGARAAARRRHPRVRRVLGYGVLIANLVLRGTTPAGRRYPRSAVFLTGAGRTLHDVGVTLFLVFVVRVFRRGRHLGEGARRRDDGPALGRPRWSARRTAASATSCAAVGRRAWWCEYAVIWTYSIWSAAEPTATGARCAAASSASRSARRERLFLRARPPCSPCSPPGRRASDRLIGDPETLVAITPAVRIVAAIAGLGSVSCSLFAFLPPPGTSAASSRCSRAPRRLRVSGITFRWSQRAPAERRPRDDDSRKNQTLLPSRLEASLGDESPEGSWGSCARADQSSNPAG